ncbi:hypothetical protein [Helicobacter pylori]|uniref:hypothetical protein n=1 Tax=Helicobacter pylori TaxID=210 RepID=UPI0027121976|nr:hypothetical protein [Helicobacter pylori]MDO7813918.1 hypothetical protein [Helicobacter pylori]
MPKIVRFFQINPLHWLLKKIFAFVFFRVFSVRSCVSCEISYNKPILNTNDYFNKDNQ